MTPLDALRAAGVTVHDARVAPRPGAFEPLAVCWHHVGNLPPGALRVPAPSIGLCQQGRQDLPGPLCQWLIDGSGAWYWITEGRASHAGKGARSTLNWVIAQGPRPDDPPRPDPDDFSGGNQFYIGVEVEGNGNWSPAVHRSMLIGTRALLAHYGLPDDNLIAHREHSRRKPDPAGIDMHAARAWLRTPPPPPPTPQEDDMPYVANPVTDNDPGQYLVVGNKRVPLEHPDEAQQLRNSGVPTKDFEPLAWALMKATTTEVPHP